MNSSAEPFYRIVEKQLEHLGKSVSYVERSANLKPDTIRNVLRAKSDSGPQFHTAQQISEALGLEFYIGPQRKASPVGFAEATAEAFDLSGAPKHVTDVFRQGYLPFPWHDRACQQTPPPFAISLAWLRAAGHEPDHMVFVEVPKDRGPVLALVDKRAVHQHGVATWCWTGENGLELEWAMRDPEGPLIIFPNGDASKNYRIDPKVAKSLQFLGRAVWTSQLEPGAGG